MSIFTLLALILVIAVFAYLGAKTLVSQPEVVIDMVGPTGISDVRHEHIHGGVRIHLTFPPNSNISKEQF